MDPSYFQTRFDCPNPPAQWPERFALITGYATTGEDWPLERSEAANARLLAELEARGLPHWVVIGRSPDGLHSEPGWAVEMDLEAALALGRKYLQDAIYWIDADTLHVIRCQGPDHERAVVGSFAEKILG